MRAAIVLAAGASRRFGRQDKLRTRLQGRSLLAHAVANARASGASRIIIVTYRPTFIPRATMVRTSDAPKGLSISLRAGLAALRPIEREAFIFLADMPFARAPRMALKAGIAAIRPRLGARPGHPMLIRVAAARAALANGDAGLAGKLRTAFVPGNVGHVLDIDTQAALQRARRHGSHRHEPRSSST